MQSEAHEIARLVRRCLERGAAVEIEGLGIFRPREKGKFGFTPATRPKVFLAYVQEDAAAAERLYRDLKRAGFEPWMDRKRLLPGQNWPRAIQQAIEVADYFVACFSQRAIVKRGCFQAELRYALDCARRVPFDRTYFIPARLQECRLPARIRNKIQYVDLFPDWDRGLRSLVAAMRSAQTPG